MLAYLDSLIAALTLRDAPEVTRLLAHPLARILPDTVRAEADAFARGACDPLAAPLRMMQLRHQTAELLREAAPVADQPLAEGAEGPRAAPVPPALTRRAGRLMQMELPLSA